MRIYLVQQYDGTPLIATPERRVADCSAAVHNHAHQGNEKARVLTVPYIEVPPLDVQKERIRMLIADFLKPVGAFGDLFLTV